MGQADRGALVGTGGETSLIEREPELTLIEARLDAAVAGQGSVVLIEGVPGIGKTALIGAARELAADRDATVLSAEGVELERELAFGVVRRLLGPVLRDAERREELLQGAARLAAAPLGIGSEHAEDSPAPGSALHGLYWLCANLCDRGPTVLAIDDLHWADEASLRAIAYLMRRAREHPLLICAASRPPGPDRGERPATATLEPGPFELLRPGPLSADGVERLVRGAFAGDAESAFCSACAQVSGGNPFLLVEAIAALRADRIEPRASEAPRIELLRSETVGRSLLARLARLGPTATAVAHALAVLGAGAPLRRVAALARLEPEPAAAAIEHLRDEGIVAAGERLEFVHPLIRNMIEHDVPSPARGLVHLRAARLLRHEGEETGRIASHLLAAEPSGDRWVVETLRSAAEGALASGGPEAAVAYLERALAEPPGRDERVAIEAELGRALVRAGRVVEGAAALRRARDRSTAPDARAALALELGEALFVARRVPDALAVFEQALEELGDADSPVGLRLRTQLTFMRHAVLMPARDEIARLDAIVQRTTVGGPARRGAEAVLAFLSACAGFRTAPEVERLARAAAAGSPSPGEDFLLLPFAAAALAHSGRPTAAGELLGHGIDAAARAGDQPRFSFLLSFRARCMLESGRGAEAEADARAALESFTPGAASISHALALVSNVLIERGEVDEAQALLDAHPETEAERGLFPYTLLIWARGRLRAAQRRPREAIEELERYGEVMLAVGFIAPVNDRWRSDAAACYLALGDAESARRMAEEELELARGFGCALALGAGLRALGLIEGGAAGVELLRESVAALEPSEARLEHAHSLVELGAAIRRSGTPSEARGPLREGLDLATRCGLRPLAERAREELLAAGGRPRRTALSGPDSLTASELRVARLAAAGRTNREIAQALFVTRRTVEVHLTSTYRKLEIASREDLADALTAS